MPNPPARAGARISWSAITVLLTVVAAVLAIGSAGPAHAATPVPTPSVPSTPVPSQAPTGSTRPGPGVTPGTAPSSPDVVPPPGDGAGGCGWFDMGCKAKEAINGFFRGLVTAALNPVFRFLARSILAAPRVDQIPRVHDLWTTSAWIANTVFVLFVVAGGMLLMGHQSLQASYTLKDVAPRLVLAVVAANANLLIIGPAIEATNALSAALLGPGVDPGKAANTLKGLVAGALTGGDIFTPILALAAVVVGLVVLITYTIRVILLVLLTAAAPLALTCHALPQTEGLARLWWRATTGVLTIQVAQALVLAAAVRVFFTSDQASLFGMQSRDSAFDLVLVICLLYILARIPSWVFQSVFRGGLGRSPITRLARTLAAIVIFRGAASKLRAARTPTATRMPPPPPPPASSSWSPGPPPPPGGGGGAPSWAQPELPIPTSPPTGTQLELPIAAPRPARSAGWVQLRLPDKTSHPPRWSQTTLPIRPRHTQTRLPAPPPRTHLQPELPLRFPTPGSPAAGRSPRRLADVAALRDAEQRARRRTATPIPDRRTP